MHFELFRESPKGLLNPEPREWYARLVDGNVIIATTGDGYVSKGDAQHAVELIAATDSDTPVMVRLPGMLSSYVADSRGLRFEIYPQSGEGGTLLSPLRLFYRWRLVHLNGNKIAHGNRAFDDELSCQREILLVKSAGPDTVLRDLDTTAMFVRQLRGFV